MENKDNKPAEEKSERRNFLKTGLTLAGLAAIAGAGIKVFSNEDNKPSGNKIKVLTTDGKLVEVDAAHISAEKLTVADPGHISADSEHCHSSSNKTASREAIPGKHFVMVIDTSRCKHALKCQDACAKYHYLDQKGKYLKVVKMQENANTSPYWMPKPCFHCDHPPCVKVCPVDATFKRDDGIVLIDNERCIGCRFCMAACPYNARVFNWGEPIAPAAEKEICYSPETSVPRKKGTVEKCDFCPDMLKHGKLPHCVPACPNGVFYFGDLNEDTVTNGDETVRFSDLMRDKAGYRYLEGLGTQPNLYYLPPASRLFPFKDAEEDPYAEGHH